MPNRFRVEVVPSQHVTAINYPAATGNRAGVTLILGHGAGADQTSGFMVAFATALADRGLGVVTFNFLYSEHRRRIPDPNGRLEACYGSVVETVRGRITSEDELAIGGKSMGGRIASQVAAGGIGELAGLVFLGYPLHPPGRPDRLRAAHLREVAAPMLFIQGSRDAFGTPEELYPILDPLKPRAELYVVHGGDHSFKVPKSAGVQQQDVYRAVQDRIETWLRVIVASRG
ncbi:MAG: dienelactone hydrolase family protein [Alphaproteobacteria bacterium]|nr:dienelactone hydrolase family protein [Alphaproteobacteria bacterium]